MWDVTVPIVGHCQICGDELGTAIRVRGTTEWVARYQGEDRLRRRIDRAVVRLVLERHARTCRGRALTSATRARSA